MKEGLNRAILAGNLGADPELKFTQSGLAVLNLRLATTERTWSKEKGEQERTDWHTVVVWGKRAEGLGKCLRKGDSIIVEGSIRNSSYEGRDGQKRYKSEINAKSIVLLGGNGGQRSHRDHNPGDERRSGYASGGGYGSDSPGGYGAEGDDIPF